MIPSYSVQATNFRVVDSSSTNTLQPIEGSNLKPGTLEYWFWDAVQQRKINATGYSQSIRKICEHEDFRFEDVPRLLNILHWDIAGHPTNAPIALLVRDCKRTAKAQAMHSVSKMLFEPKYRNYLKVNPIGAKNSENDFPRPVW